MRVDGENPHFRGLRERAEAVALLFAGDEITKTKRVMPLHASEQDRIPPPPPFKPPVKGGFFSGFRHINIFVNIQKGDCVGIEKSCGLAYLRCISVPGGHHSLSIIICPLGIISNAT